MNRDGLPSFYEQKVGSGTPLDMNWMVIKNLTDFSDTEVVFGRAQRFGLL